MKTCLGIDVDKPRESRGKLVDGRNDVLAIQNLSELKPSVVIPLDQPASRYVKSLPLAIASVWHMG